MAAYPPVLLTYLERANPLFRRGARQTLNTPTTSFERWRARTSGRWRSCTGRESSQKNYRVPEARAGAAEEPTGRRACFASVHGFGKFPRATRREAGRAEHPNLLARHLSTGPSRSPRNPHHARRIDSSVAALPRPARSSRQRDARPVPPSRAQTDLGTLCTTGSAALSQRRLGQVQRRIRRLCHRAERADLSPCRGRRGTKRLWAASTRNSGGEAAKLLAFTQRST